MEAFRWDERYVKWKITSAKGWAFHAWATEHKASIWGTGMTRSTPCYVAQEIAIIRERKKRGGK
jgi:hypothetical protein